MFRKQWYWDYGHWLTLSRHDDAGYGCMQWSFGWGSLELYYEYKRVYVGVGVTTSNIALHLGLVHLVLNWKGTS